MSIDSSSSSLTAILIEFLERLNKHRISYHLQHTRPESVLVSIAVPGEIWEVEFLKDGEVEVERFFSDGRITGEETLESLFDVHGSDDSSQDNSTIN
jgi:hypothetical protein